MTHDVTQWLAEIKTLRQQLADAQRERQEAYASSDNWRRLYETEAQQRRIEANLTRQTIEGLRQEIQQLKGVPHPDVVDPAIEAAIRERVEKIDTIEVLRAELITALTERDRLAYTLKTEQANHVQTRKSLTTALGDAIDQLAKQEKNL